MAGRINNKGTNERAMCTCLYETFLSYIKEHYNSDGSCFSSPLSLSALFGSADIFALEDVDIFLSGRENTQNTFAQIIVEAAHEGKKIYLQVLSFRHVPITLLKRLSVTAQT